MNEKLNAAVRGIYDSLTGEQKEKAKATAAERTARDEKGALCTTD